MTNNNPVDPRDFSNPLCAEVGYTYFYLDDKDDDTIDDSSSNPSYAIALSVCKKCEHISECAEWGIANEIHGVWGGLTPYDRIKIRKKRKITELGIR
jgi:hypothetical protein